MNYRKLATTNRLISEIGFGSAAISGEGGGYGFGHISEDESLELVTYAIDQGINIFDTAPIYGFGTAELRLGKALRNKREQVVVVSKCGVDWHSSGRVNMSNDPKIAEKMLHESLKRLQTDYIDLYMVHWPDKMVDIRTTVEVLAKAQLDQKILHIGLCNTNPTEIQLASEVAKIEVVQSEYHLFNQSQEQFFDFYSKQNISFMSWGTLDKGILAGSISNSRTFDDVDCRKKAPWWKKDEVERKVNIVNEIIAKMGNHKLIELALNHNLRHPQMMTALVGSKTMKQLDRILKASRDLNDLDDFEMYLEIGSQFAASS